MKKILSILILLNSISLHADSTKALAIKSAFIIKMTYFIDWPAESHINKDHAPVQMCLELSKAEGQELENWAKTGQIKSRKISIHYVTHKSTRLITCDLIYIKTERLKRKVLGNRKIRSVLTISDIPGSASDGVLVGFTEVNNKLGFEINRTRAEALGFKLSPRLLRLANIVGGNQ